MVASLLPIDTFRGLAARDGRRGGRRTLEEHGLPQPRDETFAAPEPAYPTLRHRRGWPPWAATAGPLSILRMSGVMSMPGSR